MLVDHTNSKIEGIFRITNADQVAIYIYFTFIREINAAQHIHKCCLSASVLAQQSQDFSLINIQGNIIICDDFITKAFCYML